jgi:hypothetical protein
MLSWLRRLFAKASVQGSGSRRASEEVLTSIHAALADGHPQTCLAALDELCIDPGAFAAHEAEQWFDRHPIEVAWARDYDFRVVDPLGATTEALIHDPEDPQLAPWARLLRSFELTTNEVVFHHGCGVSDLLALLSDPNAPKQIESLPLPYLIVERLAEVDELIDLLCTSDRFDGLRHLGLGNSGLTLDVRHFERLAGAAWANSLETLDLTERLIDWSVDRAAADLHAALRALAGFQSLTHLVMTNNFAETRDLAVFLEATFPALTHLQLGAGPKQAEACELLARTSSLPKLEELCWSGGPARTDPAWDRLVDAPFPVFLHGRQVCADYPKRTP